MEEVCNFCPAMAVPTTVKMPEPITAPIPGEVRLIQPRDFFNFTLAFSESLKSWSISLHWNSCDATHTLRLRPRDGYGIQPCEFWRKRTVGMIAPQCIASWRATQPQPGSTSEAPKKRPLERFQKLRKNAW